MAGSAAPNGWPQLTPRGLCRENWKMRDTVGRRGGKMDVRTVVEDRRVFSITGDWSTTALDTGVRYSTVRERGCR